MDNQNDPLAFGPYAEPVPTPYYGLPPQSLAVPPALPPASNHVPPRKHPWFLYPTWFFCGVSYLWLACNVFGTINREIERELRHIGEIESLRIWISYIGSIVCILLSHVVMAILWLWQSSRKK